MILEGKQVLVTGVVNRHSIAYAIAERAQQHGAEVLLTSFGRVRRMTERAAKRLPGPPEVLELDVNNEDDIAALTESLRDRWGHVDGAVHAIAYAPPDALGGNFLATSRESAKVAFETSAYSLKVLAEAVAPLMGTPGAAGSNGAGPAADGASPHGGSIVTLDFDASVAWPAYDWMGVAKAALESVTRYLARDLGPDGIRVNAISAGPIATPAASGIPGFSELAEGWDRAAPLGWGDGACDAVADAALFLLSDLGRGISGELLHVDGGAHAIGAGTTVPSSDRDAEQAPRPG